MFLKLLCFSVLILFQQVSCEEKLKITVYYEVLCPDSIRFFIYQLYPTYKAIGSSLNLDLVPYGKAIQNKNSQGHWVFDCQHGPSECYGNKVHACTLNQTLSEDEKMLLLNCMMSSANPSTAGRKCATRYSIDYNPISTCSNENFGDELLAHYGDVTHSANPQISFVPTIVFNDEYDYNKQRKALNNLMRISCDLLVDKPPKCAS